MSQTILFKTRKIQHVMNEIPPDDRVTRSGDGRRCRLLRWLGWAAAGSGIYLGMNLIQIAAGSRRDSTRPADCAIILGAAVWPGERPSPTLRARVERGAEVYRAGHVRHLVLTGGVGDWPPSEAEVMRRILAAEGVPDAAMVLDAGSATTAGSARRCARIMRERGWSTALLISDPWHLPRAARLFAAAGIRALPCPAFRSPTWTHLDSRAYYTLREAIGLAWQRLMPPG